MTNVILLTGATGRIGTVLTRTLLSLGYNVVAISSTSTKLEALSLSLRSPNLYLCCQDLLAPNSTAAICDFLNSHSLTPTSLINNARSLDHLRLDTGSSAISRSSFLSILELDVVVPYELSIHLADRYQTLNSIVNISSQYGSVAVNPNLYPDDSSIPPCNYGISKAAQNHLTKELAVRLSPRNIRVNSVAYGGVSGRAPKALQLSYSTFCPGGRMLNDDDLPGPVLFLISPDSSAITGHIVAADLGWTLW